VIARDNLFNFTTADIVVRLNLTSAAASPHRDSLDVAAFMLDLCQVSAIAISLRRLIRRATNASVFWIALLFLGIAVLGTVLSDKGQAQESRLQAGSDSTDDQSGITVAATVGNNAITKGSAQALLKKLLPAVRQEFGDEAINVGVNQIVNRRIVYDYLQNNGISGGKGERRLAFDELEQELAKFDQTIEQHAKETSRFAEEIEFLVEWKIVWDRYLSRKMTDEFLQEYFEQNRREFDGSRMRVAHLLIKDASDISTENETKAETKARDVAQQVFDQIAAGEIEWEAAILQYSDAPTRQSAGELGWIEFSKPMPTNFSQAAFALQPGQISRPVKTQFGCHLIKCLELEPGKIGWRDALEALRRRAAVEEFNRIVRQHRGQVEIKFEPGFRRLELESPSSGRQESTKN
jgi:parvulin-like peptidyl-prolyl isomerase